MILFKSAVPKGPAPISNGGKGTMMSIAVPLIIVAGMVIMLGATGVNLYLVVKGVRHVSRTARYTHRSEYEQEDTWKPRRDHTTGHSSRSYMKMVGKAATRRPAVSTAQINPLDPIAPPANPRTAQPPVHGVQEVPAAQEVPVRQVVAALQEIADEELPAEAPTLTTPDTSWVHGLI